MSGVAWNALMGAPNPGQAFAESFQRGTQMREQQNAQRQQQEMQAAQMKMQQQRIDQDGQKMQQEAALKGLEQHREKIVLGARLIRQVQPKDQASWDQVRGLAQQAGIDLTDVPPQFDPQYVQGLVQIADTFEPEKQTQDPSSVREYEYAKQQGYSGDYMSFLDAKRPTEWIRTEDESGIHLTPVPRKGSPPSSGAPRQINSPEEYASLPPGTSYIAPDGTRRVKGGQPGQPSAGGFQP